MVVIKKYIAIQTDGNKKSILNGISTIIMVIIYINI